jgi:hypothetical protein
MSQPSNDAACMLDAACSVQCSPLVDVLLSVVHPALHRQNVRGFSGVHMPCDVAGDKGMFTQPEDDPQEVAHVMLQLAKKATAQPGKQDNSVGCADSAVPTITPSACVV